VPADLAIRPLRDEDVPAADALATALLGGPEPGETEAARRARGLARIAHLAATDPGGAWVASRDGEVCGIALALVREGIWGLSQFGVGEAVQGRGVGSALLARTLAYGDGVRGRIILSSEHPAAIRLYARTGIPVRPSLSAAGIVDQARIPDLVGVEEADAGGIAVADAIGREIRGAGHGRDLPVALRFGARLFVVEDRAFCVLRGARAMLLAGRDEAAARTALWAAFAAAGPGATVGVDFLTAGQDWAVAVALDAGLGLSPDGPVFAGGQLGPMAPYVPSGAYL
jgi:GNAT superfamily N-acetyltransferase